MEAPWWMPLAVAVITGGFLREVVTFSLGRFKGRIPKRTELEHAWAKADNEARKRRIAEEHSSHLRRLLIEAPCVPTDTIPPFPAYQKDPDRKETP